MIGHPHMFAKCRKHKQCNGELEHVAKRKRYTQEQELPSYLLLSHIAYGGVLSQYHVQELAFTCKAMYVNICTGYDRLLYYAVGGAVQCITQMHLQSLQIALNRQWFTTSITADLEKVWKFAVLAGHLSVVVHLIENFSFNPNAYNNVAICWASEEGHVDIVQLLLADPHVDPSINNYYALQFASTHGHDGVVRLLLADARVDPSADDNISIILASEEGNANIVKLLLADSRVDPSARDNAAIGCASQNGHVEIVKLLLADPRVDPSAHNNFAIQWASYYKHAEVVQILLDNIYDDDLAELIQYE